MPAQKRVPDDEIVRAIQKWRGKISAAAKELGIAPNNLRPRLRALRVDLELLRRLQTYGTSGTYRNIPVRAEGEKRERNGMNEQRSGGAIYPAAVRGSKVSGMQAAEQETESPIKAEPARQKQVRLPPPLQDRLREAKLDLGARFRIETNENLILEQFFEESFETWLKAKLSEKKAAK